MRTTTLLLAGLIVWNSPGAAFGSDSESLKCSVRGEDVTLSWNIVFVAPILGWVVSRDGIAIADLPPEANSYLDSGVSDGQHFYELQAINFDGNIFSIGRCCAIVGDFGVECAVSGSTVDLKWGPILIDIAFDHFLVRRDGVPIARVPQGEFGSYTDENVPAGTHRYTVHGVVSEDSEFLVGACTVVVAGDGFVCKVDAPNVLIDWSRVPLPRIAFSFFLVVRDGVNVARTLELSYVDRPGPGEHHYQVFMVSGIVLEAPDDELASLPPDFLFPVGECKVVVPGGEVPPPQELTCVDLNAPDVALDDLSLVGPHDVLLVWQKPVEYDHVVIARNDAVIARIPGDQFYFVDRNVPAGEHVYSVSGVVGDQISAPAKCIVQLPRPPILPPSNLSCEFIGKTAADDLADIVDGFVRLNWENGQAYEWIVVVRNGSPIAKIAGNATSYSDFNPPAGHNEYRVFGVVGLRRSEAAICDVKVPVGVVPPPRDLRCAVIGGPVPIDPVEPVDLADFGAISADGDAVAIGDVVVDVFASLAVHLSWWNPVRYDKIIITRNKMLLATLPGDTTSHIDFPPAGSGKVLYSVFGVVLNRESEPATCIVEVPPPFLPPPKNLRCEVNEILPAAPEGTDIPSIPVVKLTWENPFLYRGIVVERDGIPIATLPGDAMVYRDIGPDRGGHTYCVFGVGILSTSPRTCCDVDVPPNPVPPVESLRCFAVITDAAGPTAVLRWENPIDYDSILIFRFGDLIATLGGDSNLFKDGGLEPGVYEYGVAGVHGGRRSRIEECRVVIDGPPPPDVLFFSSLLFDPIPNADTAIVDENSDVVAITGSGRVICMASNSRPLQGWSFGVCSDSSVLIPEDANIDGTDTALLNGGSGPTFLEIRISERGVTMAAVVDTLDGTDTLPVGSAHRLLNVQYAQGPDAIPGVRYPVTYCDTLGDPAIDVLYVVGGFGVRPETMGGSVIFRIALEPGFIRGDANVDTIVDVSDPIYTLNWLFVGNVEDPTCVEATDSNGSEAVDIADPIYTLQFLFDKGPPPPAPYPFCGTRPAPLGCALSFCPALLPAADAAN